MVIRNFIYSDSEKIRSLSSQIFEGVSESFALSKSNTVEQTEDQKGPVGSGRLLGDIFSQSDSSTETKFLEDFAYTLLEAKLISDDLVAEISSANEDVNFSKSFIKITAKLDVNDLSHSSKVLSEFNNLGEAFWRVTNEKLEWDPRSKSLPDNEVRKQAGQSGMFLNKKVADAASYILNFGYGDLIEVNMTTGKSLFSAPIKREFLRDDERMFVHKYSRTSQSNFTMLGIITQRGSFDNMSASLPDVADADGMKNAMRTLSLHLRELENTYSAPSSNEIIIDPIAIYSIL